MLGRRPVQATEMWGLSATHAREAAAPLEAADHRRLLAASRALSLHPPPRLAASERLDAYLAGSPLVLD